MNLTPESSFALSLNQLLVLVGIVATLAAAFVIPQWMTLITMKQLARDLRKLAKRAVTVTDHRIWAMDFGQQNPGLKVPKLEKADQDDGQGDYPIDEERH